MRNLILVAGSVFAFTACGPGVSLGPAWTGNLSLRSMGGDVGLAHVDPGEVVRGKVSRNVHYVSIAVERVVFPELPERVRGSDVGLGIEVRGLLPDGKTLKAVSGLLRTGRGGAGFFADHALFLEPTLYPGRVVEVHLRFQAVPREEAGGLRALFLAAGQAARRFSPFAEVPLEEAKRTFASLFDSAVAAAAANWMFVFQFFPADTVIADKPETLFTAARHILLMAPAPDDIKRKQLPPPDVLRARLRLDGNRLVDRKTGLDYVATPYVVLNITRFKRAAAMMDAVARAKRDVETAIAQKNADLADSFEKTLRDEVSKSGLSTREKHLEDTWRRTYRDSAEVLRAGAANDVERTARAATRQAEALLELKAGFRDLLEPYEIEEINFRLSGIVRELRFDAERRRVAFPDRLERALARDGGREGEIAAAAKSEEAKWRALLARAKVGWVHVKHQVRGERGESEVNVRARALDEARRLAVAEVFGVADEGRVVVGTSGARATAENKRIVENLDALMAEVLIIEEEVRQVYGSTGTDGTSGHVDLRARVALRGPRSDPGFRVTAELSRRELHEGEAVEARITTTRDAYLYVFSVDADGHVTVVIPNKFVDAPYVRAGEAYVFPPEALMKRVRLAARLPHGRSHVVETLKVVALRKKVPLWDKPAGNAVFQSHAAGQSFFLSSILKRLAAADPDDWRDHSVTYDIRSSK